METRLKQRMIGATVLTALAIIILPMLLDGSAEDRARVIARIPEPPAIELNRMTVSDIDKKMSRMESESAARMPRPVPDSTLESTNAATGSTTTAQPGQTTSQDHKVPVTDISTPNSGDEQLVLDKDRLPVSWSLQLGSFKHPENALKLREDLRQAKFHAYIIQAKTDEGEMYRVLVGPMLEKSKLATIGQEIESKFDLKGQIIRYNIEEDKGQLGG